MSERIVIKHSDATWYTTGTLEDVYAALNAGEPINVWVVSGNGDRYEERMIFYGPPAWVSTDRGPVSRG